MSFSLAQILLFIVAYLTGLYGVAYLAERGIIPQRITRHPAVYVLSLGVFAGAMASYGTVELAYRHGYSFLLYYLGVVLMFVMATLLMFPLLRLCRAYQLSSLADVLTFRFRSQWVGATITVAMCITLMPLLALQIQAVADSMYILTGNSHSSLSDTGPQAGLAFVFCIIIAVFSILFGTRHVSSPGRNDGLVTAIAFDSLIKLAALSVLFMVAVYGVFDGFSGLEQWLQQNPTVSGSLERPMQGDKARALLLIFFAGAVCMPHIFHMAFAENTESQDLRTATWGLPLYMMLLSLPILPVTWAGIKLGHEFPLEYTGLAIGLKLHSASISTVAFVAGLSAASATIIVTTLALANMCLNHLVLPARILRASREEGIYDQPGWLRGLLIALLILGGYTFFIVLSGRETLTQLALVAFIGTLQFLPGIVATLYWPNANRKGLLSGLCAGLTTWLFTMLIPLISSFEPQFPGSIYPGLGGHSDSIWAAATMASLTLNSVAFIIVSVLTRTGAEERVAAEICSMDDLTHPTRQTLSLHEPGEFIDNLPIGVCSIGGDGELLIWNRSMEQTTGIRAADALGSLLDSLGEPWREVIGDFVLGNATTVLKQEVATSHSRSRWISLHKASIDDSAGDNNDRVILVEDITDYERMEQELLHSERLASIGQLAAGVAHEIGNPVTGIACLAQNLEFETDAAEIRDTASEILKQTDRVTRIVESLVNFSHVGSRAGDLELIPSNLADCVDEAIHLLQLDHEAKPVNFENHSDRELVVLADSQRLLQVFINLLGNARDACEPGGEVRVLAEIWGDLVTIHIEDDGCGIPVERQAQVFDPFYTTKDPGEGTGLGLALVFTIMEDMDGSVQLKSPIGSGSKPGTRVTLELPLGSYGSEFDL